VTVTTKALVVIVVAMLALIALQGQDVRVALLVTLIAALVAVIPVFWDELVPEHPGLPLNVVRTFLSIVTDRDVLRGIGSLAAGMFAAFVAHYGVSQVLGVFGGGEDVARIGSVFAVAAFALIGSTMWCILAPSGRRRR